MLTSVCFLCFLNILQIVFLEAEAWLNVALLCWIVSDHTGVAFCCTNCLLNFPAVVFMEPKSGGCICHAWCLEMPKAGVGLRGLSYFLYFRSLYPLTQVMNVPQSVKVCTELISMLWSFKNKFTKTSSLKTSKCVIACRLLKLHNRYPYHLYFLLLFCDYHQIR